MTKKHFTAIAAAMLKVRPDSIAPEAAWQAWKEAVLALAGVCRVSNPKFDTYKFTKACGA